jgi:hypothetical protein
MSPHAIRWFFLLNLAIAVFVDLWLFNTSHSGRLAFYAASRLAGEILWEGFAAYLVICSVRSYRANKIRNCFGLAIWSVLNAAVGAIWACSRSFATFEISIAIYWVISLIIGLIMRIHGDHQ